MRREMLATLAVLVCACSDDAVVDEPVDAGIDAMIIPDAQSMPDADVRLRLSEMGLYLDIETKTISPEALEYRPAHELWSDGAVKRRWIVLPLGEVIDTSDMDHWRVPVGTRLFKEFVRDGVLVETRMIERTGEGPDDYAIETFVWEADRAEAYVERRGARNALGTMHDVPTQNQCLDCHEGEPGRVLGFSAVQLSAPEEPNLASLSAQGWLSDPPTEGQSFPPPGDEVTSRALGYLHANCGNCHNPDGPAFADVALDLRLRVDETTPEATRIYQTTIDVLLERYSDPAVTYIVQPGDVAASALTFRMSKRTLGMDQMPPIATEIVDDAGVAAVSAWIESLLPAPLRGGRLSLLGGAAPK